MKSYDLIVMGVGPAGLTAAVMGATMGMKVCAIEQNLVGGECTNYGCLSSKALINFQSLNLPPKTPFGPVHDMITKARKEELEPLLQGVDFIHSIARFVDDKTVMVNDEKITAKRIIIAIGTKPSVPPIPSMDTIDYLTNDTVFSLESTPQSMIIIGGGMIGAELSLAFCRLGCKCTIVQADEHIVPTGEKKAALMVEEQYRKLGIDIFNGESIASVAMENNQVALNTASGKTIRAEKLLVAAGRKQDFSTINLEAAGVKYTKRGIIVDKYLRTNKKHILAVGDCNGGTMISNIAIHEAMIGLMNTFIPWPFKYNIQKFCIPWTAFTDPELSHVGMTTKELDAKGIRYQVVEVPFSEYGGATIQGADIGYIQVITNWYGKIYGVSILGKHSGEMINEWSLAIQNKCLLFDVMMSLHVFPTIGFLSKRVAENWMMGVAKKPIMQKLVSLMKHF